MTEQEKRILASMRGMAWQRAKGELRSILEASYSYTNEETEASRLFSETLEKFIDDVESEGFLG